MIRTRFYKFTCGIIGLTTVALVCPTMAATLTDANGGVMVNVGDGFKPGVNLQDLPVGTRVMAPANSTAKVIYNDGCMANVEPGRVYVVVAQPTCAIANSTPGTSPAGPGAAPTGSEFALGGVALVGVGAAVLIASKKSSASP